MDQVVHCHTSLRSRSVAATLMLATEMAKELGITRVTEITRLDEIGVPVYSSIRPGAIKGSLCVCAGKGLRPEEARAGALMEAIEFALAEPHRSSLKKKRLAVEELLEGRAAESLLDFCPLIGVGIPLDDVLTAVEATDLVSGQKRWIPAELAFVPFPQEGEDEPSYFGNSTNGLASGNTFEEACIHGILEVVERDILSFQAVRDTSVLVEPDSWPPELLEIAHKVSEAGLKLVLRTVANEFQLPFFRAVLIDPQRRHPLYVNAGFGCHPDKGIAALRAVTEAVQSRLSFIHGGRDDLYELFRYYADLTEGQRRAIYEQVAADSVQSTAVVRFEELPDWPFQGFSDLTTLLGQLLNHLVLSGIEAVLVARHTDAGSPLQVVKVVIPSLEFFSQETRRLGPRLKAYAESIARAAVCRPQPDA